MPSEIVIEQSFLSTIVSKNRNMGASPFRRSIFSNAGPFFVQGRKDCTLLRERPWEAAHKDCAMTLGRSVASFQKLLWTPAGLEHRRGHVGAETTKEFLVRSFATLALRKRLPPSPKWLPTAAKATYSDSLFHTASIATTLNLERCGCAILH